ncbi:unnamed protein product [Nesidiocoris tenuis]|uniref:Peptide-N(4)-(N-acetyl-beta-glucosaminyl)asparagine amidase n=1 Tax=Nesidiocoris tenuis TaxID=355587 RepID=A0A6H5G8K3_9HEMI|nr:unnamed protein product [Nesidiocoris tenuis]
MDSRRVKMGNPQHLIDSSLEKVFQYEYPQLQCIALSLIPEDKLREKATSCTEHERRNRGGSADDCELCYLQALASWFKSDFFSWVNSPDCETCGGRTRFASRNAQSWPVDKSLLPRTNKPPYVIDVENHQCTNCGNFTKFPRHTDASILLDSRCGRCSEWAQVFTLMCRALGYRARYVVDVTDHVWTEVYSRTNDRWLHVDSCEAAVDQPLLYEKGWGKELSYVIGVGVDDVQDVSWRYSADHASLRNRRDPRSEKSLVDLLVATRNSLLARLAPEVRQNVMHSVLAELVELLVEPVACDDDEFCGRTSGDQQWIKSRGEDGRNQSSKEQVTIRLLEDADISSTAGRPVRAQVAFSAAGNMYTLSCLGTRVEHRTWQKLTFKYENIVRKEEADWKMVYLARKKASKPGSIEWRFDARPLKINRIAVNSGAFVKDGSQVCWEIRSDENTVEARIKNSDEFSTKILVPCSSLIVKVELSSPPGSSSIAWQHAQLFRESLNQTSSTFGFTIDLS